MSASHTALLSVSVPNAGDDTSPLRFRRRFVLFGGSMHPPYNTFFCFLRKNGTTQWSSHTWLYSFAAAWNSLRLLLRKIHLPQEGGNRRTTVGYGFRAGLAGRWVTVPIRLEQISSDPSILYAVPHCTEKGEVTVDIVNIAGIVPDHHAAEASAHGIGGFVVDCLP